MPDRPSELAIDFPKCLAADFARELPPAEAAVSAVLAAIERSHSFVALEERSPGLRGNDWSIYLRCSLARMVHAAALLKRKGMTGGRALDFGAYFGNFALMFRELGFDVDAVDSYASYAPSLDPITDLFASKGVTTLDFGKVGRDLHAIPENTYDVVLCMSVMEHVPHTPRLLLESLHRVLKPGGILILETPNVAQLPNRQRLARGEAIMTAMPIQYHASIPFEGHHREYTMAELVWMAQELHHQVIATEAFNYSVYAHQRLTGRDAINQMRMIANPDMRELILVASRKLRDNEAAVAVTDWRAVFEEAELHWASRFPQEARSDAGESVVSDELLVVDLQKEVAIRDRMLAEQAAAHAEAWAANQVAIETATRNNAEAVRVRDHELNALREQIDALQRAFNGTASERAKRKLRQIFGINRPPGQP